MQKSGPTKQKKKPTDPKAGLTWPVKFPTFIRFLQWDILKHFQSFFAALEFRWFNRKSLRADAELYLCSFDKCCVAEDKQLLNGLFTFEFTDFTGNVSDSIFSNKRAKYVTKLKLQISLPSIFSCVWSKFRLPTLIWLNKLICPFDIWRILLSL